MSKIIDSKKRLLIHYSIFNTGGAERSIIKLTNGFLELGWSIEVVFTMGGGNLESELDPRIKISYLRNKQAGLRYKGAKNWLDKLVNLDDLLEYFGYRVIGFFRSMSYLFRSYDASMISLQGLSPGFCINYVRAKKTVHWIRNDLRFCDRDKAIYHNIKKYNTGICKYICVANSAYDSFCDQFPDLEEKTVVIHNLLEPHKMLEKAETFPNPYDGYENMLKVVTVCRISDKSKAVFRMVRVMRELKEEGLNFLWFIVGEGEDSKELKNMIIENELEDSMILMGFQSNPYPFYKHADISATLSYYEGLCGTVNEAKVLGKPVLATRFSGIEEQLKTGWNGLIVENEEKAIYKGLRRMLLDTNFRLQITNNLLPSAIKDDEMKMKRLEEVLTSNLC